MNETQDEGSANEAIKEQIDNTGNINNDNDNMNQGDDEEVNISYEEPENNNENNNEEHGQEEIQYAIDENGNRIVIPPGSIIYDRDPYMTETDQSVDSGDSDLDVDGNIIGRTRPLTHEEFEELVAHMSALRETKEDIYTVYEQTMIDAEVNEKDTDWETWLADTGASCHVTYNDTVMYDKEEGRSDRIVVGDKQKCEVKMKGNLNSINDTIHECITLNNVRVTEQIGKNIISIGNYQRMVEYCEDMDQQ